MEVSILKETSLNLLKDALNKKILEINSLQLQINLLICEIKDIDEAMMFIEKRDYIYSDEKLSDVIKDIENKVRDKYNRKEGLLYECL